MPSEAAELRYPYPIEDPETLRAQRRTVFNLGQMLLDTHAEVNDDSLKLAESWRSDTATVAVADVTELSTLMKGDSDALADAAAAVTTYVGHVEDARTDIDGIRTRYDDAVDARTHADNNMPDDVDTRWEREEQRDANQHAFEGTAEGLDGEYDTVLSTLRDQGKNPVAELQLVLARFVGEDPPVSGSLGEIAYERASRDLDLTGGRYEFRLRQEGLLDGASPEPGSLYAQWLENADRQGVDPEVIAQIARDHDITPEDFEILDGLEPVVDRDLKTYFILPEDFSAEDAKLAVLMTYILNAGTDYGDTADRNDYPETPYSSAEVQRIIDRQAANAWSYDYVPADDEDTGLLATTPNGILMGIGGSDSSAFSGGTTWGDLFIINVDSEDRDVLRDAIRTGEAIYEFDDGSIGQSTRHLDLDRLLHHEEIHSQQWAALGYWPFLEDYLTEGALEKLGLKDHNWYEEDAGLSDGGYE